MDYDHKHVQTDYNGRTVINSIDRCKKYRVEGDTHDNLLDDDSLANDVFRDDSRKIDNDYISCKAFWDI